MWRSEFRLSVCRFWFRIWQDHAFEWPFTETSHRWQHNEFVIWGVVMYCNPQTKRIVTCCTWTMRYRIWPFYIHIFWVAIQAIYAKHDLDTAGWPAADVFRTNGEVLKVPSTHQRGTCCQYCQAGWALKDWGERDFLGFQHFSFFVRKGMVLPWFNLIGASFTLLTFNTDIFLGEICRGSMICSMFSRPLKPSDRPTNRLARGSVKVFATSVGRPFGASRRSPPSHGAPTGKRCRAGCDGNFTKQNVDGAVRNVGEHYGNYMKLLWITG